ncbi:hypothetical protein GC177_10980 [bacterium]|nr:hypothetical protein [bacterium]
MRILFYKEDEPLLKVAAWQELGHDVSFVTSHTLKGESPEDFLFSADEAYTGNYGIETALPKDIQQRAHLLDENAYDVIFMRSGQADELGLLRKHGLHTPVVINTHRYPRTDQVETLQNFCDFLFRSGADAVIQETQLLGTMNSGLNSVQRALNLSGWHGSSPDDIRAEQQNDVKALALLANAEAQIASAISGADIALQTLPMAGVHFNPAPGM